MAVDALLAGTPIATILVLMVVARWSAARSGLARLATTAVLAVALVLIRRAMPDARLEHPRIWGWGVLAGAAFLVPFHLLARYVGPELPTLGGALAGGSAFVAALLVVRGRSPSASPAARPRCTTRGRCCS